MVCRMSKLLVEKFMKRKNIFSGCMAALCLLLALSFALSGCAGKKTAQPSRQPMTREAQLSYYYLLYQDQMNEIKRLVMMSPNSPEIISLAREHQKIAATALERIIEIEPSAKLYAEKANLFWNKEQIIEARRTLKAGLKEYPQDRTLTIFLANSYMVEDRPEDAALTLSDYLRLEPDDQDVRERMAQMLLEAGRAGQSFDALKAIKSKDRTAYTLYLFARAEAAMNKRTTAIKTLKKAIRKNPEFIEAWAELAYQYERGGDFAEAERTYDKLFSLGDSRVEIRLRLINLNLKLKNPNKALTLALEGPGTKSFLLESAVTFISEGYPKQASAVLDALAAGGHVPSEYYFYKSVIAYEGENDPLKAMSFLDKVPESDKHFSKALLFKIQMLQSLGRTPEALEAVARGRNLFPSRARFYLLEAGIRMVDKDRDGARKVLEAGLEKLPEDTELLFQLGLLLDEMGDVPGTLEVMERVVALDPGNSEALNYLGYTLADQGRDLDRALTLIQQALEGDPDNGYVVDSLAWVYYKMGRYDEAWIHMKRSVGIVDQDPVIWEHYGDVAAKLGLTQEARKGYENSLKFKIKEPDRIKGKLERL